MLHPVRVSAGWLTGRLLLFLVILVVLVAVDAYRDESRWLAARLQGLVPDRELVERLERGRDALAQAVRAREREVNERLRQLPGRTSEQLDARIAELQALIAERERGRRSATQKTVALLTGEGFEEDLENEIDIQLLAAERGVLERLKGELAARSAGLRDARAGMLREARRTLDAWQRYRDGRDALARLEREQPLWSRIPGSDEWRQSAEMTRELDRRAREYRERGEEFFRARDRWREAQAMPAHDVAPVQSASASILEPLDELIATRRAALASAEREAERMRRSVQQVFLTALWILVVVTLLPVAIKAAWYHLLAPLVERRPPIRLRPRPAGTVAGDADDLGAPPPREKISAVSIDVTLGEDEELLVHPEFLQSTAQRARKDTRWLLSTAYPFTSLAARMVALTRVRAGAGERFVISSRNDPLAEVGLLTLADGEALVLQPRSLVGLVQSVDRPVRLSHRWVFSLSALITLQFRYLVFDGPGRLLLQGCRGVRVEPAGRGRSIDQNATLGFSAHLDYAPRRSETFGAYLLGVNGLFNDSFAGGPGYCVYEEMPYLGRRAGITGRGLEGLTDGLLKVFGI